MEVLFYSSGLLILYTYLLYPLLLAASILCQGGRRWIRSETFEPQVSLLVAAYNEERCIGEKIVNSLSIDYPSNRFEIIVVSDGSTDETNPIVQGFLPNPQIRFVTYPARRGKAHAVNKAMLHAKGHICAFSDANVIYNPDAIRKLVRNFADPKVGCVTGNVVLTSGGRKSGEDLYMRYEQFIHERESLLATAVGTDGAMYAIRRELFKPLPSNVILDDLLTAVRAIEAGLRIVYEREAIGYEIGAESVEQELKRKVRIVAGGYQLLAMEKWLLNPCRRPVVFSLFVSHKLLRWLLPWIWVLFFSSNLCLLSGQWYYVSFLFAHIFFFIFATLAWRFLALRKYLIFKIPLYLTTINIAASLGLFRHIMNYQQVTWEKSRE